MLLYEATRLQTASMIVVTLRGRRRAMAKEARGDTDMAGIVDRYAGCGTVPEQVGVDRPAEAVAGPGGDPHVYRVASHRRTTGGQPQRLAARALPAPTPAKRSADRRQHISPSSHLFDDCIRVSGPDEGLGINRDGARGNPACRVGRLRLQWRCHLYFARRVSFQPCADMTCRRRIKMSPLCQLEMTLPEGFSGGVGGDDTADERSGAFAAGGAAGFGSAAADERGGGPAFGA